MRWKGRRGSHNLEDMRASGMGSAMGRGGGLIRLLPLLFRFLGFKGTLLAVGGFFCL